VLAGLVERVIFHNEENGFCGERSWQAVLRAAWERSRWRQGLTWTN
jgi:hypothetical protein